jgi:hypothetical protein
MDTLTLVAFLFVLIVAVAGLWLMRRARRPPSAGSPAPSPASLPVGTPPPPVGAPRGATDQATPYQEPLALLAANLAAPITSPEPRNRPPVFATRIANATLAHPVPPPATPPAAMVPPRPPAGPQVVMGSTYLQTNRRSHLPGFQVGKEGEDKIAARLGELLDAQWYMFRNVVLPDRKEDIDIVLVGPGGIWALEVKAYTGNYRVENGKWYKETSNGYWAKDPYGPGSQARGNAAALCNFLKMNDPGLRISVQPVVILAQDLPIEVVSSGTDIWFLDTLDTKLANLKVSKKLSSGQVETIAAILTHATQARAVLN